MQIAIRAYGSVTSVVVPDSITDAIDRVFDLVDNGVEQIDHVLNRGKHTEELHRARHSKKKSVIDVDTAPSVKVKTEAPASSSSSSSLAVRRFRIVEAIVSESGQTIFVVTNGGNARAECSTRELAEKILRALETAP